MAYPTCKVKNISGTNGYTIKGQSYEIDEIIVLADIDRVDWATDDAVGDAINADDINICDADGVITGHMAQIAHLQDY